MFVGIQKSLIPQTYHSVTQNNTIMIILILLAIFGKNMAQFNHGVGETSFQELQQILSQFFENVSDSVPTPSRLDLAFDCSTSDNAFPSNTIDYMISASSLSAAGSASVPDETTPASAPDIAGPINTPDQATATSTPYDDPSLSSYIKSAEDLVSKLPTLLSYQLILTRYLQNIPFH